MKIDDALGIHPQALKLRAYRAQVLANNLANADTPGFKARDFDFATLLRREQAQPARMSVTHARHIQPDQGLVSPSMLSYRTPSQPTLDGNSVDTQLEHAAYAENALGYQTSLRFLGGKIKGLMTAIKG